MNRRSSLRRNEFGNNEKLSYQFESIDSLVGVFSGVYLVDDRLPLALSL
jgi:hypothetical protein